MESAELFDIIRRDAVGIFTEEGLEQRLRSGKELTVKLGADPSAPDLHLGHTVVLRKLRLMQEKGHRIVFVIGDYTAMVGDPSGKKKTRPPLTFEQTRENGRSYFEQVTKILDPRKTVIAYNSEWLSEMRFADVLTLAGKYTLSRIMERDDFTKRYAENQPIGMHELLYPLMQGYDSVALNADIEVGGTDQTFNLLVGRELQKDYGQVPQEVITFPLLPGLDGVEKMSKSLGNYIGISEDADIMFEKCMKIPDVLLVDYFRLTSDVPQSVYEKLISTDIREAHILYAEAITGMYHGKAPAVKAKERYLSVASGIIPQNLNETELPRGTYFVSRLLALSGLAESNSEARRLILDGGISLDGTRLDDPALELDCSSEIILKRGKARIVRVKFV